MAFQMETAAFTRKKIRKIRRNAPAHHLLDRARSAAHPSPHHPQFHLLLLFLLLNLNLLLLLLLIHLVIPSLRLLQGVLLLLLLLNMNLNLWYVMYTSRCVMLNKQKTHAIWRE
jgi:hypothetical protein